ncbi:MAG: acyl-CoA dehydrogenase family protein [Bacteroidetes bacterium]|nr:acyl-CoA dehydrogenase family protein [Bacteroidota bacterium]MCW5897244.1 acyl-CoA dehydrogenase family protein [Bacteroidota bacterium]
MSFNLTESQKAVQELARKFAEEEMRPYVMKYDESQEFPHDIAKKAADLGFMGMTWPEELGGAGLSEMEAIVIIEEIAKVDPSIALTVASHNSLCTGHIMKFANEEQKKRYVPDLASGRKLGAWGLTEPGSGSDSGGMKTIAARDGKDWILNGSKTFITQGSVGGTYVIMAMTDRSKGKGSISAFILEKGMKGFTIGKKENKLGMRCSDTATLIFDNVRVPGENLIGEVGQGFKQALTVLDGGRIGIAALSVGIAQGALDASVKYAKERHQFGKALAEFQGIQWKLADMATEINAARLLTQRAAWMATNGMDYTLAVSQAKLFASEAAVRATNEAVQIHGGYGFIKEFPVEKLYRDVKLMTIGEGTSEVQKMVIARQLLAM